MKPTSIQSKSFLILSSIAILGTISTVVLTSTNQSLDEQKVNSNGINAITYNNKTRETLPQISEEQIPAVDTSGWKEYKDSKFSLSFKYNPSWKVKSASQNDGWYKIEIDPGARFDNIRVYISDKDFYVMDGLPIKEEQIGNMQAKNVLGLLYGLKDNKYYYTFDLGASVSLQPQFQALVKSTKLAAQ